MSNIEILDAIKNLKGILKLIQLDENDKAELMRLEAEAESKVMMGFSKGLNLGVRKALEKKNVYACLSDNTMEWPRCSLIKLLCGEEMIGEEIVDAAEREELKKQGNLCAGDVVFYRDKMYLLKDKDNKMKVHILPLEMPCLGNDALVGSPSPPGDLYLKKKLDADINDPKLGTVVIGFV